MVIGDLSRIINFDEVQSVVRPIKKEVKRATMKKNLWKNLGALLKLNPYSKTARRMALLAKAERVKAKEEKVDHQGIYITSSGLFISLFVGFLHYCAMCITCLNVKNV